MSTPDPFQDDIDTYTRAYGMAARDGDTEAMSTLHNKLLDSYQKQTRAGAGDPNTGLSALERFGTAMQGGLRHVGGAVMDVLNLTGNPHYGPGIDKADVGLDTNPDADKALRSTTAGTLGDVAGNIVGTLPVGGAGGGAAEALGIGKLAGPGLAKTLARIGARATQAGGENAVAGAAGGDDAAKSGEVGAALSVPLGAAGRFVRGLVGKSPAAERLYQDAAEEGKDLFIPVSQGGTGPVKSFYQSALPYALGVEGKLHKQSDAAHAMISDIAAEHGTPSQVDSSGQLKKVPAPVGDTMEQTAQDTRKLYDRAYQNTVKSYAFKPPEDFHANVLDNLTDTDLPNGHKQQIAGTLDSILQDHLSDDGTLSGENLLRAKAAGREALGNLRSAGGLYPIGNPNSTEKALGGFDDIVQDAIDEHKELATPTPKQGGSAAKRVISTFEKVNPEPAEVGFAGQKVGAGRASLAADPFDKDTVHLEHLAGDPTGEVKGAGAAALQQITDLADKHGATIKLDAVPYAPKGERPPMSQKDLMDYYKERGFLQDPDGQLPSSMIRPPAAKPLNAAQESAANTVRDLENFQRLGPAYNDANAIASTAEANIANRGKLNFGKLAQASQENSPLRSLAQDAHEVLEVEKPGGVNPAGRHFLHTAGLAAVPLTAAAIGHPGLGALGVAGGNALATKTAQKMLYGDTAGQELLARMLRKYPAGSHLAGFAARQGIADNAQR